MTQLKRSKIKKTPWKELHGAYKLYEAKKNLIPHLILTAIRLSENVSASEAVQLTEDVAVSQTVQLPEDIAVSQTVQLAKDVSVAQTVQLSRNTEHRYTVFLREIHATLKNIVTQASLRQAPLWRGQAVREPTQRM